MRRRSRWGAVWVAVAVTVAGAVAAVAGVGSFGVDDKPPTKGFVAVEAYKWLRDNASGVIRECDTETDRFNDLRAVGVSKFKRQAVNCLASVGFFDGWPDVAGVGSFGVDDKPPTKGFVAVEAYKWLRDNASGVIRECDRDTDRFNDLRAVGVSKFKRQAVNCLASVGFFDGWPDVVSGLCSFVDVSDTVRAATWEVRTSDGAGTAFYVGDGEWITAEHVVRGEASVDLWQAGQKIVANVEAAVLDADLALLRSEKVPGGDPLRFGRVEAVTAGGDVYVVGYPKYTASSAAVSRGILSRVEQWERAGQVILTDAAVNPGNSGGPLVDECGRVIGVVVSKLVEVGVEGLAYAVGEGTIRKHLPAMRAGDWEPDITGPGRSGAATGWVSFEGEYDDGSGTYSGVEVTDYSGGPQSLNASLYIRCDNSSELDVFVWSDDFYDSDERWLVQFYFGDREPWSSWGHSSISGEAVFVDAGSVTTFIADLRAHGDEGLSIDVWSDTVFEGQSVFDTRGVGEYVEPVLSECGWGPDSTPAAGGWVPFEDEKEGLGSYEGVWTGSQVPGAWLLVRCSDNEGLVMFINVEEWELDELNEDRQHIEYDFREDSRSPYSARGGPTSALPRASVFFLDSWVESVLHHMYTAEQSNRSDDRLYMFVDVWDLSGGWGSTNYRKDYEWRGGWKFDISGMEEWVRPVDHACNRPTRG